LELLYVSDPIDAFFLQIQGAGRVRMPDGRDIRVSYDGQNGQAYIPIGRILVDRREMKLEDVTLQSIRAWLIAHPKQAPALMNMNPSYVFFREIPGTAPEQGPPGALGAPLTPLRSIAVDKSFIPMGAPVWIETTDPVTAAPIRQIMMAQDVGGAIKGAIRADIFFGWGAAAEERAGRMNKPGAVYIFLPRYANIPMASNSK
jgi:membrane-bound lytic murein transglycosylase A